MSELMSLVTDLCALNGVSGNETLVRQWISERVQPYAETMKVDALGNLIVTKKGAKKSKKTVMICAHTDEVGLIVTHITDKGFLKFAFVGGVDRRVAIGKTVALGDDNITGLIGLKAFHMVSSEEGKRTPKTDELYIDIGATSKEEAEALVPLGTYGAFTGSPAPFGDGFFKAKALDDRFGCAIMMKLLEEPLPFNITFAFNTMEEVGLRGAFGSGFSITPDIALILETTTAADLPEITPNKQVCHVGNGPVICHMDGGTIYDRELFEFLRSTAMVHRIPWQMKEYLAGGNDSRAIQRTKSGCQVAGISAPVRYLHAPSSVGSIADFEHCYKLTRAFIDRLAQENMV